MAAPRTTNPSAISPECRLSLPVVGRPPIGTDGAPGTSGVGCGGDGFDGPGGKPEIVDVGGGIVDVGAGVVDVGAGVVDVGAGVVDVGTGVVDVGAGVVDVGAGVVVGGTWAASTDTGTRAVTHRAPLPHTSTVTV
jgi:hypothetical protein